MKNTSLLNKVTAGLIAGGILLSASGLVYAANKTSNTTNTTTTTQEQRIDKGNPGDFMKAQLDKLVTAGTITQEQEDKILALETQKQEERKAEMDKVKNMTEAERKTYFESQHKDKVSPFAEAVTAGILTQAQADAIQSALPQPTDMGKGGNHDEGAPKDGVAPADRMKTELDSLVTAGTITQETEDKIIAYENQKQTEKQAEMDKVKNMTDEERKAYFDSQHKDNHDPFADMVTAGVLTQAQADAIKSSLPQPKAHDGMPTDAPAASTTNN